MRQFNNFILVDDDPVINLINEKIIQISKFALKTGCYRDAKEVLHYLRQLIKTDITKLPDIIFLDIDMPKMNGWEFLDELAEFPGFFLKECKVFMLSSSVEQNDIEKSKMYKMVHDFISKPLTVDKLEMLFSPEHQR